MAKNLGRIENSDSVGRRSRSPLNGELTLMILTRHPICKQSTPRQNESTESLRKARSSKKRDKIYEKNKERNSGGNGFR